MIDECDRLSTKMKIGLMFLGSDVLAGVLKKAGYTDNWFGQSLDLYFMIWIVVTGVIAMALIYPYMTCLTNYNKRHKL